MGEVHPSMWENFSHRIKTYKIQRGKKDKGGDKYEIEDKNNARGDSSGNDNDGVIDVSVLGVDGVVNSVGTNSCNNVCTDDTCQ